MRLGSDVFNQLPVKGINVDYEGSSSSGEEEDNDAQEHERSYVALHNMLLILEDDDPSLRLACRSWLQESKSDYLRILDPLLKEFMENNRMYKSFSGQLFFVNNYNSSIVIENFTKLRNIILTTQEEFVQYCVTQKHSSYISNQFKKRYSLMVGPNDKIQPNLCANKYIQVIVYTTLQFIMGQAVESMMNKELYQETQTVNASACEFMEQILRVINQYKDLSQEITHLIITPIVKTLRTSIDNSNNALQVQVLNLLRVILFECNFYSPNLSKKNDLASQAIR